LKQKGKEKGTNDKGEGTYKYGRRLMCIYLFIKDVHGDDDASANVLL